MRKKRVQAFAYEGSEAKHRSWWMIGSCCVVGSQLVETAAMKASTQFLSYVGRPR